jgi:hypothetical protein
MNKFLTLMIAGLFGYSIAVQAQDATQPKEWFNDISVSYSAGSIYYFTGNIGHADYPSDFYQNDSDPRGMGAFALSYHRKLNNVVAVGFNASYLNLYHNAYDYEDPGLSQTYYDNLFNMLASVRFVYVAKPVITMYSGVCIGLSLDFGKTTFNGITYTDKKIYPAGQLTLMGLRVGKAFGGFAEFGFGTLGIISAGLSYRMGD